MGTGASAQENYKDNEDLAIILTHNFTSPFPFCSTPSTPRHLKFWGHVQVSKWSDEHSFPMISWWQVHLNAARGPYVLLNQPCLIFTCLPFLVYFQTSLPSTLGFFVNLRSWCFQGSNGSCTTASEGDKTSVCCILVWADWSDGDSANNPWCAFTLTWPPVWHPWERHLRPRLRSAFQINEPSASLVYRFVIIGSASRQQERINTLPVVALGRECVIA